MSHPATWPPYFGLLASGGSRWDRTRPCMTTLLTPQMAVSMGGGGRKLAKEMPFNAKEMPFHFRAAEQSVRG